MDDHEVVRKGIKYLLEGQSGWTTCGEAGNGQEAIEKVLELKPDLVLMDISMPIMNGIEATKQIHRLSPSTKIVILSMHDSAQIAEQVKQSGANAYLIKSSSAEKLRATIAEVLQSE